LLDNYVYATTSPIYVSIDARPQKIACGLRAIWPPGSIV